MTIKEKLEAAIAAKDWGLVEELTKSLDAPKPQKRKTRKKVIKKVVPKKSPTKTQPPTGNKVIDHQAWHNQHLYGPVALPNRPNKFDPDEFKNNKKYTVPNDKKKFGAFAGKTFPSEEEYLKAAVYAKPVPRTQKAKKIQISCASCGRSYKLFESEIILYDNAKFRCESCILSQKSAAGSDDDEDFDDEE